MQRFGVDRMNSLDACICTSDATSVCHRPQRPPIEVYRLLPHEASHAEVNAPAHVFAATVRDLLRAGWAGSKTDALNRHVEDGGAVEGSNRLAFRPLLAWPRQGAPHDSPCRTPSRPGSTGAAVSRRCRWLQSAAEACICWTGTKFHSVLAATTAQNDARSRKKATAKILRSGTLSAA